MGDNQPRPLPSLREDSLKSSESMKSMESSDWWDKRRRSIDYGADYGSRDYGKTTIRIIEGKPTSSLDTYPTLANA